MWASEGGKVVTQDIGRRHRKQRRLNAAGTSLLADYQAVMRAELRRLLRDIRGEFKGLPENAPPDSLLPIDERAKRWNLAIKLAKELGPDIDKPGVKFGQGSALKPRSPIVVDFG
jgi:hypothetical protein